VTVKPKVFVGSSVEGLKIAYAVQENLEHDAEVTVWPQGVFQLSDYPIESLTGAVNGSDFGVFVFSPDDVVRIRKKEHQAIRDNVIFELGLFIGRLGRERNFIVIPRGVDKLHIPTDLLGMTPGTFDANRQDGNLVAALGPTCNRIREAIRQRGPFGDGSAAKKTAGPEPKEVVLTPSPEEIRILLKLAESESGTLLYAKYDGGFQFMVEGEQLIEEDTARARMRWQEGFERLLRHGLLKDVEQDGQVYHLSTTGYDAAEQIRAQRGEEESDAFAELESMMPELLDEMRTDMAEHRLIREIVVLDRKGNVYNGDAVFIYHREVHPDLDSKLQILENHGLINEITYNSVDRYRITEGFAKYLLRNKSKEKVAAPKAENESPKQRVEGSSATTAAEKPKVKWGCYTFDGDSNLYCPACYDTKGKKHLTTRLNSNRRRCSVCQTELGT
jgi:Predicted nucleotide-binding protein containing TIR-like domain